MTMWLVRAGRAGEKEQASLQAKAALIGWEELPDLTHCASREELQAWLRDTYPEERAKTLANWQSQIWPVRALMEVGDLVALPLKTRPTIAFGTVSGAYAYRRDLPGGPMHTRPVEWLAQVPRSAFDPDMLYSFGALMTVCRIMRNDAETRVRSMLAEGNWAAPASTAPRPNLRPMTASPVPLTLADLEQRSTSLIRERIAQRFKGHHLAGLVAALLETQGYRVTVSPPGIDGGVDILAGRGPLGFDGPRLVVQVKSQDAKVDVRVLRELTGVMGRLRAEHGLLVGWGGFNHAVRAEAASEHFRVRLWDGEDVVQSVEAQYAHLPERIRAEIPLKQVWTLVHEARGDAAGCNGLAIANRPVANQPVASLPVATLPSGGLPSGGLPIAR